MFKCALRIFPLYAVAVLLVWALNYPGQPGDWLNLLEHLSFSHIYDPRYVFSTIGLAWAPAVLVALCLLLAALRPALSALSRSPRKVRVVSLLGLPAALIVVSLLFKLWIAARSTGPAVNVSPLALLDTFALGMLLGAVLASFPDLRLAWPARLVLRAAALGALALLVFVRVRAHGDGPFDLFVASVGTALLVASTVFAAGTSRLARAFSNRFLLYLGLVSYGVFLWHGPLLAELASHRWLVRVEPAAFPDNAALLLGLSLLLATLTYGLIERPALQLRHLLFPQQERHDAYPQALPRARVARPARSGARLGTTLLYGLCALAGVLSVLSVPRPQRLTAVLPPSVRTSPAAPLLSGGPPRLTEITPAQSAVVSGAWPPAATPKPAPLPQVPQVALPSGPAPVASAVKVLPAPARVALIRGRQLTARFYAGQLDQVWAAFVPTVRAGWQGYPAFRTFRAEGLKAFGAEKRVVREQVTRRGGVTYYARTASFERGSKGDWTVVFGLDAKGRVQEFGIVAADL